MIEIRNLSKSYGSNLVLNNLDFDFEKGKVYGIIGENGSGKTTLFKCIASLEKYTGTITSDFKSIKNNLGFVTTEPFFFSKITGREYIKLLYSARNIVAKDIDSKNIFDLPLDKYVETYSTGMKKKLTFTAILLQENDIFIFDELFNGVDIQGNILSMKIIQKLKSFKKIIIISSHVFSVLNDVSDVIYLLKKGETNRKIKKSEFKNLKEEINKLVIGDKIERLNLK